MSVSKYAVTQNMQIPRGWSGMKMAGSRRGYKVLYNNFPPLSDATSDTPPHPVLPEVR